MIDCSADGLGVDSWWSVIVNVIGDFEKKRHGRHRQADGQDEEGAGEVLQFQAAFQVSWLVPILANVQCRHGRLIATMPVDIESALENLQYPGTERMDWHDINIGSSWIDFNIQARFGFPQQMEISYVKHC